MKATTLTCFLLLAVFFAGANNEVVKPKLNLKSFQAVPINEDMSSSNTIVIQHPCTGELIDLSFQKEISIRGTINNKNVNSVIHITTRYDGETQETKAAVGGMKQEHGVGAGRLEGNKFVYRFTTYTLLTVTGPGGNVRIREVYMITITPDGKVSMERESFLPLCQQ